MCLTKEQVSENKRLQSIKYKMLVRAGSKIVMERSDIVKHIDTEYGITPEYLWARNPSYAVFRHPHNRKWFAVIMELLPARLGLEGGQALEALNIKCGPVLAHSLQNKPGIFPGYHMNKEHWVTLLPGGPVPSEEIFALIEMSYELTK